MEPGPHKNEIPLGNGSCPSHPEWEQEARHGGLFEFLIEITALRRARIKYLNPRWRGCGLTFIEMVLLVIIIWVMGVDAQPIFDPIHKLRYTVWGRYAISLNALL
jgi:hypothetical protein